MRKMLVKAACLAWSGGMCCFHDCFCDEYIRTYVRTSLRTLPTLIFPIASPLSHSLSLSLSLSLSPLVLVLTASPASAHGHYQFLSAVRPQFCFDHTHLYCCHAYLQSACLHPQLRPTLPGCPQSGGHSQPGPRTEDLSNEHTDAQPCGLGEHAAVGRRGGRGKFPQCNAAVTPDTTAEDRSGAAAAAAAGECAGGCGVVWCEVV